MDMIPFLKARDKNAAVTKKQSDQGLNKAIFWRCYVERIYEM